MLCIPFSQVLLLLISKELSDIIQTDRIPCTPVSFYYFSISWITDYTESARLRTRKNYQCRCRPLGAFLCIRTPNTDQLVSLFHTFAGFRRNQWPVALQPYLLLVGDQCTIFSLCQLNNNKNAKLILNEQRRNCEWDTEKLSVAFNYS